MRSSLRLLAAAATAALALCTLTAGTSGDAEATSSAHTHQSTATATAADTATPYPTYTSAPTATAYPTYTPPPTATAAHRPTLTIGPVEGTDGTRIAAQATDFTPGRTIAFYWDRADAAHALATASVDAGGRAAGSFDVPAHAAAGGHEVIAVEASGHDALSAYALFRVDPAQGTSLPGQPHTYCTGLLCWCPDIATGLSGVGAAVVGWLFGGVTAIARAFAGLLSAVVRVDRWPALSGFFDFMLKVGGGVAFGLTILGTLLYYRSLLPGGSARDGALGLGLLHRTLETAVLLGGLPWGLGQLFELADRLAVQVDAASGVVAADALMSLVRVFAEPDPGIALGPIDIALGVIAFVLYLLIVLVKFASVAAVAWLVAVSPLAVATWPLGSQIAARWLASLASVLLWGLGWGVWLLLSETILSDWSLPAIVKPFLVVALLLFGYGVPRLVDHLLGAAMARLSGASLGPDFAMGAAAGAASSGMRTGITNGASKVWDIAKSMW